MRTRRNCDVIMTSGSGSDVSDDDDGVIMFSTRTSAPPASNHFFNLRSTTVWYDEVSSMTSLAQFPVLSVFVDQSLSGITCLKLFSLSSLQSDVCFRTVFTLLWLAAMLFAICWNCFAFIVVCLAIMYMQSCSVRSFVRVFTPRLNRFESVFVSSSLFRTRFRFRSVATQVRLKRNLV